MAFHILADNSLWFFEGVSMLDGVYAVNYVYDGGALANVTVIFIDISCDQSDTVLNGGLFDLLTRSGQPYLI